MNILLIGSGGREHALALKLVETPGVRLFSAPGNAGIAEVAELIAVDIADPAAVIAACRRAKIDFVVVGPEGPLVAGVVDRLAAAGLRAFGPSQAAARLEGSKAFMKSIAKAARVPTAASAEFEDRAAALAFVAAHPGRLVVKADGLAAGKGVFMCEDAAAARDAVEACLSGALGEAGQRIVIEEWLEGEEVSYFVLADGETAVSLGAAQDHKRAFDGDRGPNTGGMGAYAPAPVLTRALQERADREIIGPTLKAMAARGTPFRGVLFAGLMLTKEGPKLLEYNVRFGDPETQVLMARLESDLTGLLLAVAEGRLAEVADTVRWRSEPAVTVVVAAKGYPEKPVTGTEIRGLERANAVPGVRVLHAGTRRDGGRLLSSGGRVLNVTATGADLAAARERAYRAAALIDWPEGFYRTDIGWRALPSAKKS